MIDSVLSPHMYKENYGEQQISRTDTSYALPSAFLEVTPLQLAVILIALPCRPRVARNLTRAVLNIRSILNLPFTVCE